MRSWTKLLPLIGCTTAYFVVLWLLDYPKPMVDDLAYCGPACNLAKGGDYSNPWLLRYRLPGHLFLVCPPLHSYALAGWLRLFGVSAGSMTAFPVAMYFVTAISAILLLRRLQAPALMAWLVPLAASTALLPLGLRPEPFAIGLTMAGFALFECAPRRTWSLFAAFLLMFLGAATAPRVMFFSVALILFALDTIRLEAGDDPSPRLSPLSRMKGRIVHILVAIGRGWIPIGMAMCTTAVVFLVMIGFRFGEFCRAFLFHSQRVSERKINLLVNFLNDNPFLRSSQFLLLLTAIGLFIFAWHREPCSLKRLSVFIAAAFPFVALIGGLGAGSLWFISLVLLLFASSVLLHRPKLGTRLKVVLCILFALANAQIPTYAYGRLRGKIDKSLGPELPLAKVTLPSSDHAVLLDQSAARYVFGYNPPSGFLDIHFAAPFPLNFTTSDTRPGDIYLIGPETVDELKQFTLLDAPVLFWGPLGLPGTRRFPMHPRQVYVLPMESCHGLRSTRKL